MIPIPMQPNLPEATTALGTVVKPKQWGICPHCEKLSPMHEREWVGLTFDDWALPQYEYSADFQIGAQWAADRLKEKNGG